MHRTGPIRIAGGLVLCALAGLCAVASAADKPEIAVIPKGTTHEFWKSVHAGAVKAAQECGVDIIWQGPQKEDDRDMQIQVVQNFVSRRVDAILLAPLDEVALVRPVRNAVRRGIPVVIMDSGLKSDIQSSFVATDNVKGGELAAKRLSEVLGGKGKVILLRYAEGSASTTRREEGFLKEMKENHPGIELISTNQYAGVTRESAFQASQNLLSRYEDVDGFFGPCEPVVAGMLRALQVAGRAGKVKVIGFDASELMLEALRKGEIHGIAVQDPMKIGYLGVKTAFDVIQGKKVEKRIDTGVYMVTKENMDDPEMRKIIAPDLDKWLK